MRKWKVWCSLWLVVAITAGMLFAGCGQAANYTEEIKEYQARLEALEAENAQLRAQLGMTDTKSEALQETQQDEAASIPETEPAEGVSDNTPQEVAQESQPVEPEIPEEEEEGVKRVLVLGDSIWDSSRDASGVAQKVEAYSERAGQKVKIYNASIGGTRATLNKGEDPYSFGPGSECSLPKMVSILVGESDVEWLQGKQAYEEMKAALAVKDKLDMVIISYGMNDFLMRAPVNASDEAGAWTGYGTSLRNEIREIKSKCPGVQIMVCAPTFAYYFAIPVENYGGSALYNYVTEACVVAQAENVLCINPYDNLGMDPYNEERYLEDGVHLTEEGRDLYARGVVNCLLYGTPGTVSGNAIEFE